MSFCRDARRNRLAKFLLAISPVFLMILESNTINLYLILKAHSKNSVLGQKLSSFVTSVMVVNGLRFMTVWLLCDIALKMQNVSQSIFQCNICIIYIHLHFL